MKGYAELSWTTQTFSSNYDEYEYKIRPQKAKIFWLDQNKRQTYLILVYAMIFNLKAVNKGPVMFVCTVSVVKSV